MCLQGETVHGQVVIVNEKTKILIEQLEKESKDGQEEDVETSENSMKIAGDVYQLAKKLLSWLIRYRRVLLSMAFNGGSCDSVCSCSNMAGNLLGLPVCL